MAITLIQSAFKNAGAVTSSTLAYPSSVTAGSLLVGHILAGTGSTAVLAVSDGVNGTYTSAVQGTQGTNVTAGIFYFPNAAAGATTVTFSQTSGSAQLRIIIEEWGGIVTSTPLDKTVSNANGAVTNFQTGTTAATAQSNELVLMTAFETTGTLPNTFPSGTTQDTASNTAGNKIFVGYIAGAIAATYGGTFVLPSNDQGLGVVATFKGTGGVAPTGQNFNGALAMMGMGT